MSAVLIYPHVPTHCPACNCAGLHEVIDWFAATITFLAHATYSVEHQRVGTAYRLRCGNCDNLFEVTK